MQKDTKEKMKIISIFLIQTEPWFTFSCIFSMLCFCVFTQERTLCILPYTGRFSLTSMSSHAYFIFYDYAVSHFKSFYWGTNRTSSILIMHYLHEERENSHTQDQTWAGEEAADGRCEAKSFTVPLTDRETPFVALAVFATRVYVATSVL